MKNTLKYVLAISGLLVLIGCGNKTPSNSAGNEDLSKQVAELQRKVWRLEVEKDLYSTANFDPTDSKGYGRVDANIGTFLVTLDNVEPYLDGQKVTLKIGNPNNMRFIGFKVKATWGMRFPDTKLQGDDWTKAYEAYNASTKEKEITFTETLQPGAWNKVSFVVSPANGNEFGRLNIAIETNQVSLVASR